MEFACYIYYEVSILSPFITNVKVIKVKLNKSQTWSVQCQDKFIYQISSQYHKRRERKVQETTFLQRALTQFKVGQTRQKLNLTCITSRQIYIWNFKSMSGKMAKENPENIILAKGNNSCKRRSNATKVKLDLYHVKTNLNTKRSVMITQEMCPIKAEISKHKHLGKFIYLFFVWLAVIGFRQNHFYILPNFGDFGAKMSFFHYTINRKEIIL